MPHLVEALESLRAQSYPALSILISDNASDDGTQAYCRSVAAADPRITYRRVERNAGASENFNDAFRSTDGEYFGWAAHDDRFHPTYVARCVEVLIQSPNHSMCVPWIRFIDERGRPGRVLEESQDLGAPDVAARVRCFLDRHEWFMLYGLIRRNVLESTSLFAREFGADVILLWELLLRHRIAVIDEALFEYRRYADKRLDQVVHGLIGDDAPAGLAFLHVKLWRSLWEKAGGPGLSPEVTRRARLELARWLVTGYFRDLLFSDLDVEARRAVHERSALRAGAAGLAMLAVRPARTLRGVRRAGGVRAVLYRAGR